MIFYSSIYAQAELEPYYTEVFSDNNPKSDKRNRILCIYYALAKEEDLMQILHIGKRSRSCANLAH